MLKRFKNFLKLPLMLTIAFLTAGTLVLYPLQSLTTIEGDDTEISTEQEEAQEPETEPEGAEDIVIDPEDTEEDSDHEAGDEQEPEENPEELDQTEQLETVEDVTEEPAEEDSTEEKTEDESEPAVAAFAASSATGSVSVAGGKGGLWFDKPNKRLGGKDRYETATLISKNTYSNAALVNTVVIATGADFPDSLSGAALAARLKSPLLLSTKTTIPATTKTEITRLKPKNMVIVGGTGVISSGVEKQLKQMLPKGGKVTRLGGSDRFDTSVKVANYGWGKTTTDMFVATGYDFPDALSAAAAAGHIGAPLLLVPGTARSLDAKTTKYVRDHKVQNVHIAGGPGAVSSQIEAGLKKVSGVKKVKRYSGADRFSTAANVSNAFFKKGHDTYWANAFNFADALTGAAAAGATGSPLLLVTQDCVPSVIYDANDRVLPAQTTILGGTGVLKASVQHGNECMAAPNGASAASFNGAKQMYAKINSERFKQGSAAYRLADSKVGTPAYTWAKGKKLQRNGSLKTKQRWVSNEAVGRAPVGQSSQVNYLYNMFIKDNKNGTRRALLRSYGGIRGYLSVGYLADSKTGYGTVYVGIKP